MRPFIAIEGIAAPMPAANIDTDKLIPHRFLRKPLSSGYRNFLFHDERFTTEGAERPEFVLNREPYRRAQIIVAGPNFGCGSTREGAVYALADFGIRAIIAPSFGDIFRANCVQNGLLPIALDAQIIERTLAHLASLPGGSVSVDLPSQTVLLPDGDQVSFAIVATEKEQLVKGLDEIGITLEYANALDTFEAGYRKRVPWLF
ncbi:MAG: 3-isopropylmalate dehydratase small subunit [Burkholderiales bacterium]